jgi:hypothetical protein
MHLVGGMPLVHPVELHCRLLLSGVLLGRELGLPGLVLGREMGVQGVRVGGQGVLCGVVMGVPAGLCRVGHRPMCPGGPRQMDRIVVRGSTGATEDRARLRAHDGESVIRSHVRLQRDYRG